ncbi:hypothetical protein [Komagataeibacter sp. FNDCF1]|uniref:hypothetical protein n=1 Tax=Komagataeibacter sp. FNDCF1 TaxID=2878681 RepID=UPI001E5BDF39|nr:hypothetical protein [Komagataeibacter sp. FNDCF1]MCE2563552.1 hypothetical protein [Komagataeibacter sp. FNDCF1]
MEPEHTAPPSMLPDGLSRRARYARGVALRGNTPRARHADWHAPPARPDPVEVLIG